MIRWRRASLVASLALALWMLWNNARFTSHALLQSGISLPDHETLDSRLVKAHTVVFVPVNSGMLHLAKNLVCSLQEISFNVSSLVFWALDEGAERALSLEGFATYRDPSLYSVSSNENRRGNTAAYRRMMNERPKFFINILSAGYNILMLDADTVFWQTPLNIIPNIEDQVDAVYSTDARHFYQESNAFRDPRRRGSIIPPICNGIFWMRSSEETISIWSDMLDIFNYPPPLGWYRRINFQDDQRGMDTLLNDGRAQLVEPYPDGIKRNTAGRKQPRNAKVNVRLLDQTQVVNGHLLQNQQSQYEANLADLRIKGKNRIAAHFNWDTKVISKEEGARMHGMYFLNEDGNCANHR